MVSDDAVAETDGDSTELEMKINMKTKNRNRGHNPSIDVALVLKALDRQKVKILYEYKPSVHTNLVFVEVKFLILQCYYVLKFEHQKKILGCLTDLGVWYYFGLELSSGKLMVCFIINLKCRYHHRVGNC